VCCGLEAAAAANPLSPEILSTAGKLLVRYGQVSSGLWALERAESLPAPGSALPRACRRTPQIGGFTSCGNGARRGGTEDPDDLTLLRLWPSLRSGENWEGGYYYTLMIQHEPQNRICFGNAAEVVINWANTRSHATISPVAPTS